MAYCKLWAIKASVVAIVWRLSCAWSLSIHINRYQRAKPSQQHQHGKPNFCLHSVHIDSNIIHHVLRSRQSAGRSELDWIEWIVVVVVAASGICTIYWIRSYMQLSKFWWTHVLFLFCSGICTFDAKLNKTRTHIKIYLRRTDGQHYVFLVWSRQRWQRQRR